MDNRRKSNFFYGICIERRFENMSEDEKDVEPYERKDFCPRCNKQVEIKVKTVYGLHNRYYCSECGKWIGA
jgi:predicted RNA-binding Zn-ribbon protein involved in translation (DUF1610 family)